MLNVSRPFLIKLLEESQSIASARDDGTVQVWHVLTGKHLWQAM
ncbi:MAG TPA: hypothetical protein VKV40_02450 [Ktedonobacteraceae bacterium]|nr:hypothetical protein [Ktedonobacteraceae bacterium]